MKAVIQTGSKQYIVQEGDRIKVELLQGDKHVFEPLAIINDDGSAVFGKPIVSGAKVEAKTVEAVQRQAKVMSIRYKAKKRVNKVRGHRQNLTVIDITKVSAAK